MIDAAISLLESQEKWIEKATGLVSDHVKTTQQCIDSQIRDESY